MAMSWKVEKEMVFSGIEGHGFLGIIGPALEEDVMAEEGINGIGRPVAWLKNDRLGAVGDEDSSDLLMSVLRPPWMVISSVICFTERVFTNLGISKRDSIRSLCLLQSFDC
ncbi:hypothetical protein Nepgr_030964 [Nepenthes gracilis]|uniref:Uncharacterized protein n=1 Tax=Nepenthes gracilis TaxID=150966 RepID=A0AAD3THK4_NEPGR|nr:hypothetical protein Nepgr_030964 [Nepenthes gracilis]